MTEFLQPRGKVVPGKSSVQVKRLVAVQVSVATALPWLVNQVLNLVLVLASQVSEGLVTPEAVGPTESLMVKEAVVAALLPQASEAVKVTVTVLEHPRVSGVRVR